MLTLVPPNPNDPPPEELDMIVEELTGQPAQRATAEGITKVEQRIAYLQGLKEKLLAQQFNDPVQDAQHSHELSAHVRSCDEDLTKARALLAQLQQQYEARN